MNKLILALVLFCGVANAEKKVFMSGVADTSYTFVVGNVRTSEVAVEVNTTQVMVNTLVSLQDLGKIYIGFVNISPSDCKKGYGNVQVIMPFGQLNTSFDFNQHSVFDNIAQYMCAYA